MILRWVLLLGMLVGLTACKAVPRVTDSAAAYRAVLQEVSARPNLIAGSATERLAIDRLKAFLSDINATSVRDRTLDVYAPDAYLNDTLVTRRGATNIQAYFLATADAAESVTATIEDVTRAGDGTYYFRWVMDVRMKKVAKGETIRTLGITQVRFDESGRVLIHQDYWDSAAGLWEHVPVIGRGIRTIRARL
jgi:hypothetical protein